MSALPKVSFYPLKQIEPQAVLTTACRLAEKAFGLGMHVHLLGESAEQLVQLDNLLWQYKPESFLPHCVISTQSDSENYRITLGCEAVKPQTARVLINLANEVWQHHAEFKDIRDIVSADALAREQGRTRFRFYKSQGYPVETLT